MHSDPPRPSVEPPLYVGLRTAFSQVYGRRRAAGVRMALFCVKVVTVLGRAPFDYLYLECRKFFTDKSTLYMSRNIDMEGYATHEWLLCKLGACAICEGSCSGASVCRDTAVR